MGIWLFDENERQSALNVLESILSGNSDDEGDVLENNSAQLKSISVSDLLGGNDKEKSPSILEILSKAKTTKWSLERAILDNFDGNLTASTSLKSFTNSDYEILQENPQLLAPLHQKLAIENNNKKRT